MKNAFLHQAAQQILADHPTDLHRVLVLLPNKRGEIFLKRELGSLLEKPALAPEMKTIEEFVQELSGYQKRSQLQLLITLYRVYKKEVNSEETFDNFIKWGNTLLHDFNEIDRHLIDAQQLFNNLLDVKRIESWGVTPGNESELMRNFLNFWKDLFPLYNAFHAVLDQENAAHQGKAYRKVASDFTMLDNALADAYSGMYLLGFNALNAAEERIFRHLVGSHNATALWDADRWYTDDDQHEAGAFLRRYRKWPEFTNRAFLWQHELLTTLPKQIQVISAPTNQGIAQAAGRVLQDLPAEEAAKTALVLADEALLLPVLDAIPKTYQALNVTMGLPINHAALAQDMLTLLRMHEQAERTKMSGNAYSYYHRTFLATLETKLCRAQAQGDAIPKLSADVILKNRVFLTPKKAIALASEFGLDAAISALFSQPESAVALLQAMDEALRAYIVADEQATTMARESAFALHTLHQQAIAVLQVLNEPVQMATLLRLYQGMLAEHQVDFYGEPLQGLQVMGMLETRTLDFKRVIITSMNEGILPTGKSQNSFIPYDLKRGFGLPTYDEKDAIYAYHFYRLLQRAEEVWLIYDSDTQGVGVKEQSRFVFQIENELAHVQNITLLPTLHYNPQVQRESIAGLPTYNKDEAVLERLKEMATKGFSPTSLAAYLQDPAQFYKDKVLRVREMEEVAETIGYDVLGNVVHKSLEELYKPLKGKVLQEDALTASLLLAPKRVTDELTAQYPGDVTEGRNLLISKVALHMVEVVLKQDINRLNILQKENQQLTLVDIEAKLTTAVFIPELGFTVTFSGSADRIDRIGNAIYILDYKTGYINKSELNVPDVQTIFEREDRTKAFQVLFYAWVYAKNQDNFPQGGLTAGIFSTRQPSNMFMTLTINKEELITKEVLEAFEKQLIRLVLEIFEATKPFAQRLAITEET